jgi:hypothetical protein
MGKSRDTRIIMYSGESKPIQEIKVNDVIMGDDHTPRQVLQTLFGYTCLYRLILSSGDPLIISGNQTLCFKIRNPNKIYYSNARKGYVVDCLLWNHSPSFLTRFFGKRNKLQDNFSKKEAKNAAIHYFNEMLTSECCLIDGDVVQITLERFINLNINIQRMLKLYNVIGIDIEIINVFTEKEQEYFELRLNSNRCHLLADGLVIYE